MRNDDRGSRAPSAPTQEALRASWERVVRRRSFLRGIGVAGAAGAALPAAGLLPTQVAAAGTDLSRGDAAILRFLAAAELIESDLWQQYRELGGVDGGNKSYQAALSNLDADMPQYISDNTDDELSHAAFINAYLSSRGAQPVNLDKFRVLASSKATGANQSVRRLTTLQNLNVDTSWYTRYRGTGNPDLGASFPQALTIKNEPAIPVSDQDTPPGTEQPIPPVTKPARRMQAIANTAGFHFAFIEQGGSSLYTTLSLQVSDVEVLRIVVSIGGVEVNHYAIWHDKVGNAVSQPLAGVVDPETGLEFPDFNAPPFGGEQFQTNLIMPEPCDFIRSGFPQCSVIRPSSTAIAGARAAIRGFKDDGLFAGQSKEFFDTVNGLAAAADAARRDQS